MEIRRRLFERKGSSRFGTRQGIRDVRATAAAGVQMSLHPGEVVLVQGAVHEVGEQLIGMTHASSSDVHDAREGSPFTTPRARPSAARPRKTLDFTVPTGISSTVAISS